MLAAMLNAGAIGLAIEASPRLSGIDASASNNLHSSTMILVSVPSEPDPPVVTRDAARPIVPPAAPRRSPPNLPAARTVPAVAEAEAGPPQQILFYTFREVDTPAFPESDWNLDAESLDSIGVQRLVFEVLISNRGQVVGCTVLEPSNLADDSKRSLEKRLSETSLQPALRAGQLVASVRRIELFVPMAHETQVIVSAPRQ